jgi:hypothetical protein
VGLRGLCKGRGLFFFMDKEMKIVNWAQDFLCSTE